MIKTILRQIITHCAGTQDIIKKLFSGGLCRSKSGFKTVAFLLRLSILVIGFTTVVWANLRILVEIPSHPVAFLRFNLLICLLINSSLMGLNSNDEGSVRLSLIFKILG